MDVNYEYHVKREVAEVEQEDESSDNYLSSSIGGYSYPEHEGKDEQSYDSEDGGGTTRRRSERNKRCKMPSLKEDIDNESDDGKKERTKRKSLKRTARNKSVDKIVKEAIKRELEESEEEEDGEDMEKQRKGRRPRTLKEARTEEEREWVREQNRKTMERRLTEQRRVKREETKRKKGTGAVRTLKEARTEEERERIKEQLRKDAERRRKRRMMITEEQKRENNEKIRERRQTKRAIMKGEGEEKPTSPRNSTSSTLKLEGEKNEVKSRKRSHGAGAPRTLKDATTEEERERIREQYRKDIERRRQRYKTLTPEQKREIYDKAKIWRITKKSKEEPLDEDELRRRRMENYLKRQAYLANLSEEKKQRRREKERERQSRKWKELREDPERLNKLKEQRRRYFREMPEERKQRYLEKMRERARIYLERRKKEGERKVEDGRGNENQKRVRRGPLEEEDKKRLYFLKDKRNRLQRRLMVQNLMDSGMSIEEIMQRTEPAERRQRRLILQRLEKARRTLRTTLLNNGAPEDLVINKVKELEETYQPNLKFRPLTLRKRVDPKELQDVEEELNAITIKSQNNTHMQQAPRRRRPRSKNTNTSRKRGETSVKSRKRVNILQKYLPIKNVATKNQKETQIPQKMVTVNLNSVTQPPTDTESPQFQQPTQPYPPPLITPGCTYSSQPQQTNQFNYSTSQTYPTNYYLSQSQNPHLFHRPPQTPSFQTSFDGIGENRTTTSCTTSSVYGGGQDYGGDDDHTYEDHGEHLMNSCSEDDWEEFKEEPQKSLQQKQFQTKSSPPKKSSTSKDPNRLPVARFRGGQGGAPLRRPNRRPKPTSSDNNGVPKRKRKKPDEVIRDSICDLCGESFNHKYILIHRKFYHNPHFDPLHLQCLICQERFKTSQKWYSHFLNSHPDEYSALNKSRRGRTPAKQIPVEKVKVCPECGRTFTNQTFFSQHMYYKHGEGQKKENQIKCPASDRGCDASFITMQKMRDHVERCHEGHNWTSGKHRCYRCERRDFRSEKELREHVKVDHPEDSFPCEWCGAVRFTQLALNFHYSGNKCARMPKGWKKEEGIKEVEGWEVRSLEKGELECEICGKRVSVMGMTFHYEQVHNVVEERSWGCLVGEGEGEGRCEKVWKRREFVAVHMEEAHRWGWEDIKAKLETMNGGNREGLRKEGRRRRRVVCFKRRKRGFLGMGRRYNEEEEGESSGDEEQGRRRRKKKRNVKVICEEDGDK